jgi:hypothetical protein
MWNIPPSYSESYGFNSQPTACLQRLNIFGVFLIPFVRISGYYVGLKLSDDLLVPISFHFIH